MKHLNIKISSLFVISLLIGCTSKSSVSPSQNNELSNITNPNKIEKNGYMQNSLDSWLKKDWEPTVKVKEKAPREVQKKENISVDDSESFTLQKYVDKASLYMKAHPIDENSAHYKKIESLPAIGK